MSVPADRRARAAVVAALIVAVLALAWVLLHPGGGTYELTARFDQVNGLVEGADVEVAGIGAGQVDHIGLSPDGVPEVTMSVDDDFPLRRGATADVRATSASGEANRFVQILPGDGPLLPKDRVLDLARTDQPVEIGQVLSTLDPATRKNLRSVLAGLDTSLAGRSADIAASLRNSAAAFGNTADAVEAVNADGQALRTLVRSGRTVVGELASDPGSLGSSAERMAAVLRTTAGRRAELGSALRRLPAGLSEPRRALDRLDASLSNLRSLVADAKPGVRALVPFSGALRPALVAARPALRQGSRLVTATPNDLRRLTPLLDTARPVLRTLAPTLRSAGPILDEARVRTPDFFSFFSNWADFTAGYDANGHAARVGIVLSPAPLNRVDGSGDGPGHLQAPFVRTPGALEGEPWRDYRDSFLSGGGG